MDTLNGHLATIASAVTTGLSAPPTTRGPLPLSTPPPRPLPASGLSGSGGPPPLYSSSPPPPPPLGAPPTPPDAFKGSVRSPLVELGSSKPELPPLDGEEEEDSREIVGSLRDVKEVLESDCKSIVVEE